MQVTLASDFAKYVLCQNRLADAACGQCQSCHLFELGNHADIKKIKPEDSAKAIKVDQIRDVNQFIRQSAHQAGYKIIIISPAQNMNVAASNALLKSLEEPGKQTLFILVAEQAHQLLPTINSRCQVVSCTMPTAQEANSWLAQHELNSIALEFASGAPLLAQQIANSEQLSHYQKMLHDLVEVCQRKQSVADLSASWQKYSLSDVLHILSLWLSDEIKLCFSKEKSNCSLQSYMSSMTAIADKIGSEKLYRMYFQVLKAKKAQQSNIVLNTSLLIESVFAA